MVDITEQIALRGDHPIFQSAELSWVHSDRNVRLRLAKWKNGKRGTVHIFNGRTEYIEKYADVIERFVARGFSVTAHDWRGQGLSTRNSKFPKRCHVMDFDEFQHDAHAIMLACQDMPHPRQLFCHSMGGAIGLRFLSGEHKIQSAVFSAPMWGIYMPIALRPFAKTIANWAKKNGREWNCVFGTKDEAYETYEPFWKNLLTNNRDEYEAMKNRLMLFPELATGGPTYFWYFAAQNEIKALQHSSAPEIPMLSFVGSKERVVDANAIREMGKKHPNIRVVELKGAKHESYIEREEIQQELWSHIDSFWLTN